MVLTCVKCGEAKDSVEFSPRKDSATGFNRQCRKCRIYLPIRKEDRTEAQNDKIRQVWRNRHYKNANRDTARRALRNAVKNGRIEKAYVCETCGSRGLMHGHHEDYTRPLDVKWLCEACHLEIHVQK